MTKLVWLVALAAFVAPVERQEEGVAALQLGGHGHFGIADSEVHQRPAGEAEQRLGRMPLGPRIAIEAVLVDGVLQDLGEVGLQLHGRDRHAVQIEHQVEAVLVGGRVAHLPRHPQAVGLIAAGDLGVHAHGRLELRQVQPPAQPHHVEPAAQHVQHAPVVERLANPVGQHLGGGRAVGLAQGLPGLGLAVPHPGDQILDEQRPCSVMPRARAGLVDPAVRAEMVDDIILEADLLVQAHTVSLPLRRAASQSL